MGDLTDREEEWMSGYPAAGQHRNIHPDIHVGMGVLPYNRDMGMGVGCILAV